MRELGNNCQKEAPSILAPTRKWRPICVPVWLCLVLLFAQLHSVFAAGFSDTNLEMTTTRKNHTATTLADGRVLITGGVNASGAVLISAEIYNPATGTIAATGNMMTARVNHTATLLPGGKVLIAGGYNGSPVSPFYEVTAELFDPSAGANGAFAYTTGSMGTARENHTASLLDDGTVLMAGGDSGGSRSSTLATAQIYNPSSGTFSPTTGPLSVGRRFHTATLLKDGRVLLAGGEKAVGTPSTIDSAELYNPAAKTFATVAVPMKLPRKYHTATPLNDVQGRVLLTGSYNGSVYEASVEIFDPTAGTNGTFSTTASMAGGRGYHTATRLPNGKVLIAGGSSATGVSTTGEVFNPADGGSFSASLTMAQASGRSMHSAALLNNGTVFLSGGIDGSTIALFSTELYDPDSIKVSPESHIFPATKVSIPSTQKSFRITNSGAVDLTLNSIGITGTDGAMFTLEMDSCGSLPLTLAANGGECSVSVKFIPTSGGVKSASLDIGSTDPERPLLSASLQGTGIPPTITILFEGTGAGSTTSAQEGLSCLSWQGEPCQAQVEAGTEISVFPVADKDSLFAGWSGDCTGSDNCTVTVNADSSATASFIYVEPARIVNNYFFSLQDAYAGVFLGFGDVIEARAFTFTGPVVFEENIALTLKGGFDITYSANPDYSVVDGGLTIGNGSVTLEHMIVNGKFTIRNGTVKVRNMIVQ